jgi:hypothetical protein
MPDCPICRATLRDVTLNDEQLQVCDRCKGILIDQMPPVAKEPVRSTVDNIQTVDELYNFKCTRCSSRNGSTRALDKCVIVACEDCGQCFCIDHSHVIFEPAKAEDSAQQTVKDTNSGDSVFQWLGELLSALSGGH